MIKYPQINPIAFHLGPLPVHWYGLMYLLGFSLAWALLAWRIKHSPRGFTQEQLSDILFYGALGVILGGRLGYIFFYEGATLLHNPLFLFEIWKGGMSFHGGLIGVILALWIYARKIKKPLRELTDFVAPVVPLGLAAGRIGNFINGELWGRTTDLPWGMVFPNGGDYPRHPSQLYEFLLEGIILFIILWAFSHRKRPLGSVSGLFLVFYGLFRFFSEFFRVPDTQVGYLAFGWFTEGQLLSLPMLFFGIVLLFLAYKGKSPCNNT